MHLLVVKTLLLVIKTYKRKKKILDFPHGTVDKNPPANARDTGSIHGLGRSHFPQSNQAQAPQLQSCTLEPML